MINAGLHAKVALVTGANHGIGAGIAKALAAEGARVFVTYLRLDEGDDATRAGQGTIPSPLLSHRAETADEVVKEIRGEGGQAEAWEADLADPATIPRLFDRVEESLGSVDVLVNNAAHWEADTFVPEGSLGPQDRIWAGVGPISNSMTPKSHDRHFAVNSRAVALMTAELARRHIEHRKHWGRIINVSTDGAPGFPGETSYGASKHAMESYSRAAAMELGRHGITVNIVSPGAIQTGWISAELEERWNSMCPLGRVGQPDDIADVVVFLASEQARFVTGQLIYVGGGHVMSR